MVRLRLTRRGAKKAPFYRLVAANSNAPSGGRFIENLGYYNPTKNPQIVELKEDRVIYWLQNGAQPSETARSLFRKQGILKKLHESRTGAAPAAEAAPEDAQEETSEEA